MRSIAVINQKGGVGKTTTTINLGHALANLGNRVTLVDLDPQGHLAACMGLFRAPHKGIDEVLLNGGSMDELKVSTRELIDLIPAGDRLDEFEYQSGGLERAKILRDRIAESCPDTDYLLFDCPPSAGMLVANTVVAVDDILVPVAGDYLSLTGLARLMLTLKKLEALRDKPVNKWIFLSRFVPRRRLSQEALDRLLEHFSDHLLSTQVREAAVMAECAGAGRSIFEYRPKSKSAAEFAQLADDLLNGRILRDEQEKSPNVA